MRFLHIASMAILIGSAVHTCLTLTAATTLFQRLGRSDICANFVAPSRPWVGLAIVGLVVSGIFQILAKPPLPEGYISLLTAKLALATLVFGATVSLCRGSLSERKRRQLLTGIVAGGLVITLISAYLRWLSAQ
jgi:hypothetical protein